MLLQLGRHTFDISTRAVVVGSIDASIDTASACVELVGSGADAIEVTGRPEDAVALVGEVSPSLTVPFGVATNDSTVAEAALGSGASFVVNSAALRDPHYLVSVGDRAGGLVVDMGGFATPAAALLERARWALAAQIGADRLVLGAPNTSVDEIARHGLPTLVRGGEQPGRHGIEVAAMMAGARLFVAADVRATKRTLDTTSELLERRGVVAPHAVVIGSA